jgi:hypothetical protein
MKTNKIFFFFRIKKFKNVSMENTKKISNITNNKESINKKSLLILKKI